MVVEWEPHQTATLSTSQRGTVINQQILNKHQKDRSPYNTAWLHLPSISMTTKKKKKSGILKKETDSQTEPRRVPHSPAQASRNSSAVTE